jgi:hypothetical protein
MTSSLGYSVRRMWQTQSQKPFVRLVRLFAGRVFHGSGDSSDGELDLSLGLVLSLLALPGGFYSILLLNKYATLLQWMRGEHSFDPLAEALPDEYFFIVLSMTVTGVVAVWCWDRIFPDNRDYSNLVPLPMSMRSIFLANLVAILFLTVVLALDVNAASAVLFPLVVSASENAFIFFVQFVWVHAVVVVLASIFSFLAVFVAVGVLMTVLPQAVFRRISLYLRAAMIAGLVATLTTSFAVPAMLKQLPDTWVRFLPPVWFLGLCQMFRGRAGPSYMLLGRTALFGSGVLLIAAVVTYTFGYSKYFVRISEAASTVGARRRRQLRWIGRIFDDAILRSPFQRAGYRFAMKTLLRSEVHGLVLAGFCGLGIVIASQFLFLSLSSRAIAADAFPSSEIFAVPLILSYCLILGVRFVLDIPTEIRANWIFRMFAEETSHGCVPLARKLVLTFVLPWVLAIVFPLYGYLWGWRVGIVHALVVMLWSLVLTEMLLLRFHKIPFTCSYPPFRDSAVMSAVLYVLGFFVYVVITSKLEYWSLVHPIFLGALIAIVLISWCVLSRFRTGIGESEKELIFEESGPVSFELLDLGRGS